MALRNQPYIPLYVQDFLTDEKLIECSASATGVYIRLLCIMHKSDEYGTILLKQKDKQTDKQIKNFALKLLRQMPYELSTIEAALTELVNENVLQIEGDKLLQRRMIKDNDLSIKRASSGSKGGKNTQFAKAKVEATSQANSENENENANEIVNKDIDKDKQEIDIQSLWIRTWGRNPKIPEIEETEKLISKYGYDKVYLIMKESSFSFKNFKTLINALDDKGNIIAKGEKKELKTITLNN